MVYYNEDKLKSILYDEFYYRKIDEYGGKTSIEFWNECRRYFDRRMLELRALIEKNKPIKELEPGYIDRLKKERESKLERKAKELETKETFSGGPIDVETPKPLKKRWRLFGFGRKQKNTDPENP